MIDLDSQLDVSANHGTGLNMTIGSSAIIENVTVDGNTLGSINCPAQ